MHCTAVHTPATLIQFRLHFNAIDSRLDTRAHKIPVQTTLNQHSHTGSMNYHSTSQAYEMIIHIIIGAMDTTRSSASDTHISIDKQKLLFSRSAAAPRELATCFCWSRPPPQQHYKSTSRETPNHFNTYTRTPIRIPFPRHQGRARAFKAPSTLVDGNL